MTWPPQSPDLNPFETLWSHLGKRVRMHKCSSKKELETKLPEEWQKIDLTICNNLVNNMQKRIKAVIKAKWGHTTYWLLLLMFTPLFLTFKYISLNHNFDFSLVLHNFGQGCIYIYIYHHHHHVVLVARISLTLSRHFSLSFIVSGRSSGQHPVSSHSCWMYVLAGRPAFERPCVGVHKSTTLMSSSLLLQQCPKCLVRLTWIVSVIGGRWPYSWCLVGCCRQDLFRIARSILV